MGFMPKSESGVGLANIRERLAALYGGRAELIISVPPTGGTCATIKVPYEIAAARPEPSPPSEIRPDKS
jgi:sensor histidine kinase YesM